MNADILFQITAIGVIVAVLNQLLIKSDHSEHALMVTIAGLIMVLVLIVGEIGKLFDALKMTFNI
ncbi:MAG: stage III sporulation protein AC [Clostridia bacterium]|nr:stage III sporulation protein AC [Clostridia bacterium]